MKMLEIGRSGLHASAVALGCMHMHGHPVEDAVRILENAAECGVNFFDHADIYGAGESERVFGQALKQSRLRREDILIQSKCGIREHSYDFSKEYILKTVDDSLRRLQVDYLDTLLLHRPDALVEPEEVAEAFDQLQNGGKVRQFGVSNHHSMQMELLQRSLNQRLVANQLRFSPVHTGMVDCGILVNMKVPGSEQHDGMVLDYCRLNDVTIQAWSPYRCGESGDEGTYFANPAYEELNRALQQAAQNHGITAEGAVAAWILRHPAGIQMIAGTMRPKRMQEIAKAADTELSRDEWYDIYLAAGNKKP